jgi:hypothetical protein
MFFYNEDTGVVSLNLLVSSASLSFPNTCVDDSSQNTFIVTATGNTTETVTLSDNTDQYSFSPSSFQLSSTSSQTVTVTFAPTSWGVKTGSINLVSSGGSTQTVSLSAVCVANPLIITSSVGSVQFQNTIVNQTSSATFVVSAGGTVQDIVLMSDNSDQFDFSPSSFSMTGANQTQTVTVYFTPTSIGSKVGVLTLSASGGDVAHVSMSGSAYNPFVLTSSADTIQMPAVSYTPSFNASSSATLLVWANSNTINPSETVYAIKSLVNNPSATAFTISPTSSVVYGDAGNTKQTFTIKFNPTYLGAYSASVLLSSSGGNTKTIALSGNCVESSIVTSSLYAYYDVNKTASYFGTGLNWNSMTTTNRILSASSISTMPVYVNKNNSYQFEFDGINDFFTLGSQHNFFAGPYTISMWIKTTGSSGLQTLISNMSPPVGSAGTPRGAQLYINKSQGTVYFSRRDNTASDTIWTTATVNDGLYHNIVVNASKNIFIDGVYSYASSVATGVVTNINSGRQISVGRNENVTGQQYYSGSIVNIQIYNRELSLAEIQQNYNSVKPRFT